VSSRWFPAIGCTIGSVAGMTYGIVPSALFGLLGAAAGGALSGFVDRQSKLPQSNMIEGRESLRLSDIEVLQRRRRHFKYLAELKEDGILSVAESEMISARLRHIVLTEEPRCEPHLIEDTPIRVPVLRPDNEVEIASNDLSRRISAALQRQQRR
jgi:hypothetical protein